jgi:hypothetical protein
MKKLFDISSEEKQRILEMHETATKKNYLNEQLNQKTPPPVTSKPSFIGADNTKYYLPVITDNDSLSEFISFNANMNKLKSIGIPATENPTFKVLSGNKMENNKEMNATALIGDYLEAIAEYTKSVKPICSGDKISFITAPVTKKANELFRFNNNFDAAEVYKIFNMTKDKFEDAVAKAAQLQIKEEFPNACNA